MFKEKQLKFKLLAGLFVLLFLIVTVLVLSPFDLTKIASAVVGLPFGTRYNKTSGEPLTADMWNQLKDDFEGGGGGGMICQDFPNPMQNVSGINYKLDYTQTAQTKFCDELGFKMGEMIQSQCVMSMSLPGENCAGWLNIWAVNYGCCPSIMTRCCK